MLRGKRPLERTKVRHWKTADIKKGQTQFGYIAGSAVVVSAHGSRRSKPCLREYFGQAHGCVGCTQMIGKCQLAYQPYYCAITDKPTVAVFHEDMFARLDSYKLHQKVKIGRPDVGDNPGLWICSEKGKYESPPVAHQGEADICEWLPILFKMRDQITGDQLRCGAVESAAMEKIEAVYPPVTGVDKAYEKLPIDLRKRMNEMFAERSRQGLEPIPFAQLLEQLGHTNGTAPQEG